MMETTSTMTMSQKERASKKNDSGHRNSDNAHSAHNNQLTKEPDRGEEESTMEGSEVDGERR